MASYEILLPRKKRKSSFENFGGSFGGTLRDDISKYENYVYWVFGVPGTEVKTGWYATKPNDKYMELWENFVYTHDKPEIFNGDYRNLFGYSRASKMFKDAKEKY
jgi:hypothetical protein